MLRQLVPRAAGFLPTKKSTTNYPFSVLLLGVVITLVRIYVKSLHKKITGMNEEMTLLRHELERKRRREARIAYRNRSTFNSWRKTTHYRWKRTASRNVMPRTSSSVEEEIISAGAATIHCNAIVDLTKNTPWTPGPQLQLITRSSAIDSRINHLQQIHTALVWYVIATRYILDSQTTPADLPLDAASSTSEPLTLEAKGPAEDQTLSTISKPEVASPIEPAVPKQAAASKQPVDPAVPEPVAASSASTSPAVPTTTEPAPASSASKQSVVPAVPESVVEPPVSKPLVAPAISEPAVKSHASQPLVVPATPKITTPIVPVVPKQVVASPASKSRAAPAASAAASSASQLHVVPALPGVTARIAPVVPNRNTASTLSKSPAIPVTPAVPTPAVASPVHRPPIFPQKGLEAWGSFQRTDRQEKEEEQKRFYQAKAAREAEEARTGVKHEPQQPKFSESWKQVKVGDDNERRIVAVHKGPAGSSPSSLSIGDGGNPPNTNATPAPAVAASKSMMPTPASIDPALSSKSTTPKFTIPAPASAHRTPTSTPISHASEVKKSNTTAETPPELPKGPMAMRVTPREVPRTVIAGTQRSGPSTSSTRSNLSVLGGQSVSSCPFSSAGADRAPHSNAVPSISSNSRIPTAGNLNPTNAAGSSNPMPPNRPHGSPQHPVNIVCRNWRQSGRCPRGTNCRYMHHIPLPPCRNFNSQEGCTRPDCKFPHVLTDDHN